MSGFCKIYTLYSGSGGNSVYVRIGDNRILIDAGKNARKLCSALQKIGESIENIDAIFITHEHTDHISALEVISKHYGIPIYMTEVSAQKLDRCPESAVHKNLCRQDVYFCVNIGDVSVSSFRTPHDSRMSVGYRIEYMLDGTRHSIGIATDIGYVSDEVAKNLRGCEAVIIESNHDEEMLMCGPYPRELKLRVASRRGHLSNKDCAEFALSLAEQGTYAIMLAHLSRENNEPMLAYETTSRAIEGLGTFVCVASPDEPTELPMMKKEEGVYAECEAYNPWNA